MLGEIEVMLGLIVAFLCGAALTLLLVIVAALTWLNSQPVVAASDPRSTGFAPFIRPQLPQVRVYIKSVCMIVIKRALKRTLCIDLQQLREMCAEVRESGGSGAAKETCKWFNLIADFLFRELRDSMLIKRLDPHVKV